MRTYPALIVVGLLYFQWCAADGLQVLPAPPSSVYGFKAEQVAANVHTLNQGDEFHLQPRGNVGIIEQSDGVVLIDSGGSADGAEQVIAFVRSLTDKPVSAIVITHWHGDHALGVAPNTPGLARLRLNTRNSAARWRAQAALHRPRCSIDRYCWPMQPIPSK